LEFNVPFQHKYGYIRDEERGGHTAAGILGNISAGFANEGPVSIQLWSRGPGPSFLFHFPLFIGAPLWVQSINQSINDFIGIAAYMLD